MLCDKENLCVHEVNTFQQVNALYDFNLLVNTYFSRRELKIIICMYWELLTRFLKCKMNNGYGFYVRRALKRYFSLFSLDIFSISQEKDISKSHLLLEYFVKTFLPPYDPKTKKCKNQTENGAIACHVLQHRTERCVVFAGKRDNIALRVWKFTKSPPPDCLVRCSVQRHWSSLETALNWFRTFCPSFLFFCRVLLREPVCWINKTKDTQG